MLGSAFWSQIIDDWCDEERKARGERFIISARHERDTLTRSRSRSRSPSRAQSECERNRKSSPPTPAIRGGQSHGKHLDSQEWATIKPTHRGKFELHVNGLTAVPASWQHTSGDCLLPDVHDESDGEIGVEIDPSAPPESSADDTLSDSSEESHHERMGFTMV